jgi:hypothetical protein
MTDLDLKKLFPHGDSDYRSIAFVWNSLPFLGDQYEFPEEGVPVALNSIGWGIDPPNSLETLIEENSEWFKAQIESPEFELLPEELFCSCCIRSKSDLLKAKEEYFRGFLDWSNLQHSWHMDVQKAADILYDNGQLMDFQVSYGQPDWSQDSRLEQYRDEIYKITTAFWHEIHKRHLKLLGKSKLIATYSIFEPDWEFRSLGGCFYHVTFDDGPIKVILPEENLLDQLCNPERDCVQYGEDGECVVDHECIDDSLEDMRATLTLLQ